MLSSLLALMIVATPAEGALALEARLLAPCCYQQTLDIHASPMASALRTEIRERLERGEAVGAIEADLVARHGPRVRAVPYEGFLTPLAVALFGGAAVALIALLLFGRRRANPISAPLVIDDNDRAEVAEALQALD